MMIKSGYRSRYKMANKHINLTLRIKFVSNLI